MLRYLTPLLLLAACADPQPRLDFDSAAASVCTIARVTDGDTVVCEDGERVRLLLIDTPEMDQGEFGTLARLELLKITPPGARVRMEFDVEREDRYGRTLAYLYTADGRFVNEEMARSGYALVLSYPPNVKHIDRIREATEEARAEGAGLWGMQAFDCPPVDHRAGRCDGG